MWQVSHGVNRHKGPLSKDLPVFTSSATMPTDYATANSDQAMSEPRIRQCTWEGFPEAVRLYGRLFTDYGDPVPDEGLDARFGEYLLVAEIDGEIVGFLCAERQTIAFMESEIGRRGQARRD